jgi:hypothetical protein
MNTAQRITPAPLNGLTIPCFATCCSCSRYSGAGYKACHLLRWKLQAEQKLVALKEQLKSFGRDPAKFGTEGWLRMHSPAPQDWAAAADGWRRLGADMVMLYPMYRISNFDGHIENLRRFKEGR